jgi:hypothetical protein
LRDGHFGSDNTFRISLDAGTYTFTLRMGDYAAARDHVQVYLDGSATPVPGFSDLNTTAGAFFTGTFTVPLSAGLHTLRFKDNGGAEPFFSVNSLEITGGSPQLALGGTVTTTVGLPPLTQQALAPVVAEARARWNALPLTAP